ncbi:uncharacterized protein LOC141849223 [Brevipalpus obovatus]|uniref:uncharacterized protein LOC141849223 n=1 Tax=Brevipalpus obovatus TaxID=246614 RepID=UPI003D9F2B39
MAPITKEIKQLIIDAYRAGQQVKDISKNLNVNLNSVKTVIFRFKKDQKLERERGHRPKKLEQHQVEIIRSWFEDRCQTTLQEAADKCEEEFGIKVCPSTICNYLDRIHFSFKRISPVPERRNSPENIRSRKEYARKFLQLDRLRDKIFFIDETGIAVHCRLNYGWSKKGERCNLKVRAMQGKKFSVCAAMNHKSLYFYEIKEYSYDSISFVDYLKNFIEKLKNDRIRGAILIMDNVPFHHKDSVEALIKENGHKLLFLPAYSPFLNPIENLFNELKHYVKKLNPSTPDEVFTAIRNASEMITEQECENYYANMLSYVLKSMEEEIINN